MHGHTMFTVRRARIIADENQREDPEWSYVLKIIREERDEDAGLAEIKVLDENAEFVGYL